MVMICVEVLLFLAIIIARYQSHAFNVSIQTYNSLPVIGGDLTLGCTFMPQTESRRVTWENGDRIILFSQACWFYPECVDTVPHPSKFSLLADLSSGNLTIKNLTKDDSNNYQCTVSSEFAADLETSGSSNMQVTTLLPAPPNRLSISDDNFQDRYLNDAWANLTDGLLHNITCVAHGARPPAVLEWRIPDDVVFVLQDQYDVVRGNSYVSWKAVTLTPSKNDEGKNLRCVASHPVLQNHLQISIYLNAPALPVDLVLSLDGDTAASPGLKEPSFPRKKTSYVTIALGVIASAGFILLISLGLVYFYGVLCCMKRKKARRATETTTSTTTPPVATTKLQLQQVSQEVYAEVSSTEDHKFESPKSTKGFYMDMKPIPSSQSAIRDIKPSSSSTNDYVSPSITRKEHEPVYASADDLTYVSAIRLTGDVDNDDDNTTITYMDMNSYVPMGSCSHDSKTSGPPNKGYFGSYTKPRKNDDHVHRAETVYTNTEYDKAPQKKNHNTRCIYTVPITTKCGDVTTTYMEINPEMASEFCSHDFKPSESDNEECISPSFGQMKNADREDTAPGVNVNTENPCQDETDDPQ